MIAPIVLWQQLEADTAAPTLTLLPCLSGPEAAALFAGLLRASDTTPARLLLLRVPVFQAKNIPALPEGTTGLAVDHPVEYPDDPTQAYVSLRLTDPDLGDQFAVLAYDIAGAVEAAPATGAARLKAFLDRIASWQELFGRVPPGGLSGPARQGLYGELALLRRLLAAGLAPASVVAAWVGPQREAQDFQFGPVAIEVKTTGPIGQTIRVSNAAQLDDSLFAYLWLHHLALRTEPTGETLPALVATLTATLASDAQTTALFQARLQLAGYFHAQAHLYGSEGFTITAEETVRVAGELPRLRRVDLPAAIGDLTYSLDLAALVPHRHPFPDLLNSLSATLAQ